MSLSSQTDVTPNKKQRRGIVVPLTKSKSNLWEAARDSNPHFTTIRNRYHLVVAVLPFTPVASLSLYEMCNSHFIWIFRAFHAHQTATFSIVLAPTILRSGAVRLPT